MAARAFITGLAGSRITPDERSFLRAAEPWGLILFKRNVQSPAQLHALIDSFREAVGRRAPVLVDQEGGRVQRLGPPHWPSYPSGAVYGRIYDADRASGLECARLGARLIAADLASVGIDVDCLPVADLLVAGADPVIGDRAYGETPQKVAAIAAAVAEGLEAGGVLPVMKHMPGHGRSTVDSHLDLPRVDAARQLLEETDFVPFRALRRLPLAMTAHIVFTAIDPDNPATASRSMIDVIRGSIGFDGALMSDDISMGALAGSIGARAGAATAAGCDLVLHCNGRLVEMEEVAEATAPLAGEAERRAARALAARRNPQPLDPVADRARFAALIAGNLGTKGSGS